MFAHEKCLCWCPFNSVKVYGQTVDVCSDLYLHQLHNGVLQRDSSQRPVRGDFLLSIVYYWPHFTTDSMGGESIQIPFLLLSLCLCLSLSLSLPLLGCENMCVCVCVLKNPKIRLTQSHHDVVGIYKTTRCAQLEVCVCVCVCARVRLHVLSTPCCSLTAVCTADTYMWIQSALRHWLAVCVSCECGGVPAKKNRCSSRHY